MIDFQKFGATILCALVSSAGWAQSFPSERPEVTLNGPLMPTNSGPTFDPEVVAKAVERRCQRLSRELKVLPIVSFDWSTPPRYGLDANNNQIVDLPNSPGYVQNTDGALLGQAACPIGDKALFRIDFSADISPLGQHSLDVWDDLNSEYELLECDQIAPIPDLGIQDQEKRQNLLWQVESDLGEVWSARGADVSLCLPEGRHTVTLRAPFGEGMVNLARSVEVVDHFVVLMGDSFASGEGAPEKVSLPDPDEVPGIKFSFKDFPHMTQWADPGIALPTELRQFGVGTNAAFLEVLDAEELERDRFGRYFMYHKHRWAHRSSFTGPSQLALQLEQADDKSSVTFVNLAKTGATIDQGVLGHADMFPDLDPIRGEPEAQYDDLLALLLGGRRVDHIYLSVGGNDAGFKNVITSLFIASEGQIDGNEISGTVAAMQKAFNNGNWDGDDFGSTARSRLELGRRPGLDGLRGSYRRVDRAFDVLRVLTGAEERTLFDGPVTLIAPPYFGSTDKGGARIYDEDHHEVRTRGDRTLNQQYCDMETEVRTAGLAGGGIISGDDIANFVAYISVTEFEYADHNIFTPLLREMRASAQELGWRFIDQGQVPGSHGICGVEPYDPWDYAPAHPVDNQTGFAVGTRWYRTPFDGAILTETNASRNAAQFHPNELGYAYVKKLLLDDLPQQGIEGDGLPYDDVDDSIVEVIGATSLRRRGLEIGRLGARNDVNLLPIEVGENCPTWTFTAEIEPNPATSAHDDVLTLNVFGINGALLASSNSAIHDRIVAFDQPDLAGFLHPITDNGADAPQTFELPGGSPQLDVPIVGCFDQSTQGQARQSPGLSELTFVPRLPGRYFLGVSYATNSLYDPVTGRGDNRKETADQPRRIIIRGE